MIERKDRASLWQSQESGLPLDAPGRAYIHQRDDRDPDFLGNKLSYSATFSIAFLMNICLFLLIKRQEKLSFITACLLSRTTKVKY